MCRIFEIKDGRKLADFSLTNLDEIKNQLANGQIHGLAVNTPLFTQNEINLLAGFKDAQVLAFRFNKNKNLSLDFVKDLPVLDYFGVDGVCPTINFDLFNKLKTLIIDWNPKVFKNPESSKLIELHLWKVRSGDFETLSVFSSIQSLLLNKATMNTLTGIEKARSLRELKLIYMPNLSDISAISGSLLSSLSIQNAKKIDDYSVIGSCKRMARLRINDSSPIKSLKFIDEMESLRSFRFMKNDVTNGDLSPLLRLDDVDFTPKKHFSHGLKSFKKNERETSYV